MSFPINSMVIFHSYVNVYQRVYRLMYFLHLFGESDLIPIDVFGIPLWNDYIQMGMSSTAPWFSVHLGVPVWYHNFSGYP